MKFIVGKTDELAEKDFYDELEKQISAYCPINQRAGSIIRAMQYLESGKSITIHNKYFKIKKN